MSLRKIIWLWFVLLPAVGARAQTYDLLIKGGHVIDAKNNLDAVRDVAITDGKIAQVAANIPAAQAKKIINAAGLYVTPGLVDIHVHVFYGFDPDSYLADSFYSLPPDGFTFRSGVTTVVDAGTSGWKNFPVFKRNVIDRAKTRVLAFLNVSSYGLRGETSEQDLGEMDAKLTALRVKEFPQHLVGIKTAHYAGPEWDAVDRAVEAGRLANVPVMVDFGDFHPARPFQELVLKHLRPGDMYTHMYLEDVPLLDAQGKVRSYLREARQRGVLFDVGHGADSFPFKHAVPAIRQGWLPDSISTDLYVRNMNAGMKDMLNVMSKIMNIGLSLSEAVRRATWNPAQQIKRPDLGHLSVGAEADVTILNVRKGQFGFIDAEGLRFDGTQKLECELTLRAGQIVWDLNGRASAEFKAK